MRKSSSVFRNAGKHRRHNNRFGFKVLGDEGDRIAGAPITVPLVVVHDRVECERFGVPEPWPPVDAPVKSQQPRTREWRTVVDGGDRVQRCPAKEAESPLGGPLAGAVERFIEEIVVVEGDTVELVGDTVVAKELKASLRTSPFLARDRRRRNARLSSVSRSRYSASAF